ncbi:hypothetical protein OI921_09925 [Klebsiella pneumoniae]|nr:hypothetical protein OI921_09925 [Klebsiella pneumoniae]
MTTDITELAQSLKHRVCDGLYVKADDILKLVDALEGRREKQMYTTCFGMTTVCAKKVLD